MNPSPLNMDHYYVTSLSMTANSTFDAKRPIDLKFEQLQVEHVLREDQPADRHWQVTLRVMFRPGPDVNVPYHFMVEMIGLFQVDSSFPEEMVKKLVETNATGMLFGIAREILRSTMSAGPFIPLILPTVSFLPDQPAEQQAAPEAKEKTA